MSKFTVMAGWDDVPHLTAEMKAQEAERIPAYQMDARSKGIPQLGAGAIYPVPESDILVEPFKIPDHFCQCYGMDVGWNRTAGLACAIDRDTDVAYLYAEHYRGQSEPSVHAQAIRAWGTWLPGVMDVAARGRGQKDGEQLMRLYRDELGLTTLIAADNAVEAGLYETWTRLTTGRLKVFKTLQNWLREYRLYRRDDRGHVVKENDHLMDTMRYIVMSGLKIAIVRPASQWQIGKRSNRFQSDYDPYGKAFVAGSGS